MIDDSRSLAPADEPRLELYIFVGNEDGECWFKTNHRFVERPDIETTKALFEEAKQHFRVVYPDVDPADFSVELAYLDAQTPVPSHRASKKS